MTLQFSFKDWFLTLLLLIDMLTWQHMCDKMQKNHMSILSKFELILISAYIVIYKNVNHFSFAEPQDHDTFPKNTKVWFPRILSMPMHYYDP